MERRAHGRILAGVLSLAAAAGMPLAAGTAVFGIASPAAAQVLQVSPWHAVVTSEDVVLRCGHGDLMYPVAGVPRGQVLRVDGEGQGWARVWYPAGVPAFVQADSVTVDPATRTATVTKATRLKAFNMTTGLRGSWKDILDESLPTGTKLTVVDAEPVSDGRGNASWRIVPPESARAFVPLNVLRRASEQEVQQHQAALAANPPTVAPAAPARTTTPGEEPTRTAERTPAQPANLADPIAAPSPTVQAQPPAPAPVVQREPAPQPRRTPPPANRFDRLESAFESIRQQNPNTAEFSELQAEFEKAIASLDNSPASQVTRSRLQQRVEFLKLRADLQAQRRKLAEFEASLSEDEKRVAARLAEVESSRQYTIVGRLSASTIYDGERLPLMYRVQSVGGPAPRTLAYVRPDDKLNIDSRLGQIVGVLGDATMDPSLRVNIITPVRVDVLEAATTVQVEDKN